MRGQLFSLDIIAAGLAFILLILGAYFFLISFQSAEDRFDLFATRLNEVIFSEDPYYGIGRVVDEGEARSKLIALGAKMIYHEKGKRSYFEIYFDPPIGTLYSVYEGACNNAEKKLTFHRYVMDENNQGHRATLIVCLK